MATNVWLRKMTAAEYARAAADREAAGVSELSKVMSVEEARERVRQGASAFLPDGVDTAGHRFVVAEDESGEVVGDAWIGPDPRAASGSADSAWLYDINVFEQFRRRGFGSAILRAAEELVANEGKLRLALNVVGSNTDAIGMYRANGYKIASMFMDKQLQ